MPLTPTLPLPLSPSFSPTATHAIPFTSSHYIFSCFGWRGSMWTADSACVFVYMLVVFLCWGGSVCPANQFEACWHKPCLDLDVVVHWNLKPVNQTYHCWRCFTSECWILSGTLNDHTCVLKSNHLVGSEQDHMTAPIDFAIQCAFWDGGEDACKHTRLLKHTSYC